WAFHQNYDWAVKHMVLGGTKYPDVAVVLLEIFRLACNHSPEFRRRNLPLVLKLGSLENNHSHVLSALDALLQTNEDFLSLCQRSGLDKLSSFIHSQIEKAIKISNYSSSEEGGTILRDLILALSLLVRSTEWILEQDSSNDRTL